jgi:hypothetical protein
VKDVNAELVRAAVAEIEEIEADIRSRMEDSQDVRQSAIPRPGRESPQTTDPRPAT